MLRKTEHFDNWKSEIVNTEITVLLYLFLFTLATFATLSLLQSVYLCITVKNCTSDVCIQLFTC